MKKKVKGQINGLVNCHWWESDDCVYLLNEQFI